MTSARSGNSSGTEKPSRSEADAGPVQAPTKVVTRSPTTATPAPQRRALRRRRDPGRRIADLPTAPVFPRIRSTPEPSDESRHGRGTRGSSAHNQFATSVGVGLLALDTSLGGEKLPQSQEVPEATNHDRTVVNLGGQPACLASPTRRFTWWAQKGSNLWPLALRRNFAVAGRRLVSPEGPVSCTDRRWTSPRVA